MRLRSNRLCVWRVPLFIGGCAAAVALAGVLTGTSQSHATLLKPEWGGAAQKVLQPTKSVLLGVSTIDRDRLISVGERGLILLSEDAGLSWRQVPSPVNVTLTAVRFVDARSGWIVGHGGTVLHSQDGGEHWAVQLDAARAQGLAKDQPLFDLYFKDAREGWVVGAYGAIFHTQDGGLSWESWSAHLDNPENLHLYSIATFDEGGEPKGRGLYVVGEGGMELLSNDGGISFHRIKRAVADEEAKGSLFLVKNFGDKELLIAGMDGKVYLSSNAGHSWKKLEGHRGDSWLTAARLRDGQIVIANQLGQLAVARADSNHLIYLPIQGGAPVVGLVAAKNGVLITAGMRGVGRIEVRDVQEKSKGNTL